MLRLVHVFYSIVNLNSTVRSVVYHCTNQTYDLEQGFICVNKCFYYLCLPNNLINDLEVPDKIQPGITWF